MNACTVGVCSSPVHCDEIGRCFSARVPAPAPPATAAATCDEPDSTPEKLRAPRVILAGPEPLIESLRWHDAAAEQPDDARTVLIWTGSDDYPYETGHWDGEHWISDAHGGPLARVLYWSQPEGPAC